MVGRHFVGFFLFFKHSEIHALKYFCGNIILNLRREFMLKKIFLICCITLFVQPLYAQTNYQYMCRKGAYPVSNGAMQFISNASGTNFLLTKIVEATFQKELKKEMQSNFNVEIKAYGAKNFLDGKFKNLTVESKKINSQNVSATNFYANSLCDYNHIILKDDKLYFAENFLLEYSSEITDNDLKRTVLSPNYLNLINKIDLSLGGLTLFKIHEPTIEIKNNRIYMSAKMTNMTFYGTKTQIFKMNSKLKVQDEKIVFTDVNIGSNNYGLSQSFVLSMINNLNPFVFNFKIDDNNRAKIKVKDLKIENNTIYVKGIVIIPKNYQDYS